MAETEIAHGDNDTVTLSDSIINSSSRLTAMRRRGVDNLAARSGDGDDVGG